MLVCTYNFYSLFLTQIIAYSCNSTSILIYKYILQLLYISTGRATTFFLEVAPYSIVLKPFNWFSLSLIPILNCSKCLVIKNVSVNIPETT